MANIQIKRGQDTSVDIDYKLGGATSAVDLSGSSYDVELAIRRKRGSLYDGQLIDVLRFGNSSPADSAKDNRITLHATAPNIKLFWNTTQSAALPNEEVTVAGDVKITQSGEVVYSIRLLFDIIPEITA